MNTPASDSRIVVTGMGWITPLGNSIDAAWDAMVAGQSGVARTTLYDAESFPTSFSAEVKDFDLRDFLVEPTRFMHTSRRTQFLLAAVSQAWSQANVNVAQVSQDRIGLYLANGEGVHDFATYAKCCLKAWDYNNSCLDEVRWGEEALNDLDPLVERENDPSSALLHLATLIGARGPGYNTLTACAASLQAIGEAITILRRGEADVMLVGGSNSMIHPLGMTGFNLLGALSTRNDSPISASRPFDRDRDGFVIGEGAGILVLETMDHAQRRHATILAELSGYGSSADAYRVTDQHPESSGMIRAMQQAVNASGVKPEQIDYINAHGTGTRENDRRETAAIRKLLGNSDGGVTVSSIKSMIGHLITAAGVVETIASIQSLRNNVIPPTINLETEDPECDLDYVPQVARKKSIDVVLTENAAFGGQNSALIIRKFGSPPATKSFTESVARRRVVVTGIGAISALGLGTDVLWSGITKNSCALKPVTRFNPGGFKCQIGGEVPQFSLASYLPGSYRKAGKLMARDTMLAVVAAHEAMSSAGLLKNADPASDNQLNDRFSCHIGASVLAADVEELASAIAASMDASNFDVGQWGRDGLKNLQPLWMLKYLPNMLASHLSIIHGLTGTSNTITTGDSSGYLSLGEAYRTIASGDADRALCGGIESQINLPGFVRHTQFSRLNSASNDRPESAVRPFDSKAEGTILGEGGAIFVLENLESAVARNADILAEIVGFAATQAIPAASRDQNDGSYSTALQLAIRNAGLNPLDVDLIMPRGSGVLSEDNFEMAELQRTFGSHMSDVSVMLSKPHIGDLGAGNVIGAAAAVAAIRRNRHPSIAIPRSVKIALSCSSSENGQNAAIVFRGFEG